jgi:hypothetical protein
MTTINNLTTGIFQANSSGKVSVDYLYDGGGYQGELAIFSLQGMENLEVGSSAFLQEATRRALSNSQLGYIAIKDKDDRARFSDLNKELGWEGQYNSGIYSGKRTFQMQANSKFAMMLVSNGTVASLAANPNSQNALFSFKTAVTNGKTIGQIADVTGKGNTFAWEDVNLSNIQGVDRDYNDLVIQVQGATANAPAIKDSIYANRDWLKTKVGQELIEYANRPVFNSGTFTVNSTGRVEFDYLYDGGWYQGELAVFSLKGMGGYQPGSIEFLTEASKRALSNSKQGRILMSDRSQGAHFSDKVAWENNFNIDAAKYAGVKSFEMEAGDELAFMLVQNTTIKDINQNPYSTSQVGKKVLFSTDLNQIAAVDNKGTLAFEDVVVSTGNSDRDYNDLIFQTRGLESSNTANISNLINTNRDWRNTSKGKDLLKYADRTFFNEGVFEVGETGKVTFDYLYDGGWYQGELAVFSLEGMDAYQPGSNAFIAEATRRALTNSNLGHILANDRNEGARFTQKMSWENNFNTDPDKYKGVQTFTMNPGGQFAFMLVQNTTVSDISNPTKIWQGGKMPLFSIPEANPGGKPIGQMVNVDGNGTYAFEDVRTDIANSDRDYNDFIFQIKGAKGAVSSMDLYSNSDRDWRKTSIGGELLKYANRATFDEGVFQVGNSGQVIIDFLYDGGFYQGAEVGIFSLNGMDMYEAGSKAFIEAAINRAKSNSTLGYTVVQDLNEKARFSGSFNWEGNFNAGQYKGRQTFLMNPGDTFGLVLIPDGTLNEALTAPDWAIKKDPLFSMSAANFKDQIQFADIFSNAEGTIIGFEDVRLDLGSNHDYNDVVLAIEGARRIGLTDIDDVMAANRNWLKTTVGQEVIHYFDNF